MKRTLLATCVAFIFMTAYAQENSYIVKTRGALQKSDLQLVDHEGEDETAIDFISQNFKYHSLCDWKEGMKFMVIPDKYDLVVKTFTDASTDKDVSNVKLRHKIMIYQGHEENGEGHERINFRCQDDNRMYYYDISGTFDDYCFEKQGIPTLAYLGDVDIAREKLVDKELYTKTDIYSIDTEIDGDGYKDVIVDKDVMVKVTAVGVGTRDFPVKIIVEDKDGNEFYQNVAISKTNCSLRDDDFVMDNARYLFANSFELVEDVMNINSSNYRHFLGKVIHTKYPAKLLNEFSKKMQSIPRLTEYQIESITPHKNYTSHYLVIKTWARKNGDTPTVPIQPVPQQPTITQQVLVAMAVTHENVIRRLFVTYGKSADVDRQNAYVSLLKRYPVEVLHTVTEQLMLSEEFLPAVSVVSQRCAAAIDRQRRIEMSQRMTGGGFNV